MKHPTQILRKHYSQGKPFVLARITIPNPVTGQQATFEQRCWIDTGFDGGVHVPEFHRSDAAIAGVQPRPTTLRLGGGVRAPGYVCFGVLKKIQGYNIPSPGIETELVMQGSADWGLIGLDVLKNWIAEFNGPSEILSIHEST